MTSSSANAAAGAAAATAATSASANDPFARRRICLFGTSANPPTGLGGHLGIVSHISRCHDIDVDEVRVLPVYRHMYSVKRNGAMASYDDRLAMCRLTFRGMPNVTVSDLERVCFNRKAEGSSEEHLPSVRVGTADLLDMLCTTEPESDFTLALGTDTFLDLASRKWKRSNDILSMINGRILVVIRPTGSTTSVPYERKSGDGKEGKGRDGDDESGGYPVDGDGDGDRDGDDGDAAAAAAAESFGIELELMERIRAINEEYGAAEITANIGNDGGGDGHDNNNKDENENVNVSATKFVRKGEIRTGVRLGFNKSLPPTKILRIDSLSDVSSSLVRSSTDEALLQTLVVPDVLAYMKRKKLYGFATRLEKEEVG